MYLSINRDIDPITLTFLKNTLFTEYSNSSNVVIYSNPSAKNCSLNIRITISATNPEDKKQPFLLLHNIRNTISRCDKFEKSSLYTEYNSIDEKYGIQHLTILIYMEDIGTDDRIYDINQRDISNVTAIEYILTCIDTYITTKKEEQELEIMSNRKRFNKASFTFPESYCYDIFCSLYKISKYIPDSLKCAYEDDTYKICVNIDTLTFREFDKIFKALKKCKKRFDVIVDQYVQSENCVYRTIEVEFDGNEDDVDIIVSLPSYEDIRDYIIDMKKGRLV